MVVTANRLTPATLAASAGGVVLEVRGIRKLYGTIPALVRVDAEFYAGEVHAIVGENGAGKTTLMRILAGEEFPDSGEIRLAGRPVRLRSPNDARALGVAMVHQHFALAESMTVAENLALALAEPREWRIASRTLAERARRWAETTGLDIPPLDSPIADLSVGARQRVEILKALVGANRVLILDEPTAVLTPQETQQLFALIRRLRTDGRAVLFISHKLAEVAEVADRVTVLRQGQVVARAQAPFFELHTLAEAMIGERQPEWTKPQTSIGAELLRLETVGTEDDPFGTPLRDVSFNVRAGEIFGIAGVDGNGQRELFEVLAGLRPLRTGTLRIAGTPVTPRKPTDVLEAGVGFVPPDRHREGLILEMTVFENLLLHCRTLAQFTRASGALAWARARAHAEALVREYNIRAPGLDAPVRTLSGGNQQRVILARELAARPEILIAANPTRGLDFAATRFVFHTLAAAATNGAAVVLISTDLDEILALSDRVAVLYRGRLSAPLVPPIDPIELGALMGGIVANSAN
ncbi:MAG: ABC transporter ATP-binding protein [Candidatus Binatia bacterium]|nr:ABC transporter ATP-binding protein [Candidatus Binatia bacterium]